MFSQPLLHIHGRLRAPNIAISERSAFNELNVFRQIYISFLNSIKLIQILQDINDPVSVKLPQPEKTIITVTKTKIYGMISSEASNNKSFV